MNKPISMQMGTSNQGIPEARAYSGLGLRRSQVRVAGDRSEIYRPGGGITVNPLGRVDVHTVGDGYVAPGKD